MKYEASFALIAGAPGAPPVPLSSARSAFRSERAKPLRAAFSLKPPALPGAFYPVAHGRGGRTVSASVDAIGRWISERTVSGETTPHRWAGPSLSPNG
jgi:hypothetical protein